MRKIRVLVVDDSVVIRRIVSDALASDPDIEVAGVAANGKIALAKLPVIAPDLVTLDVEMPELDGISTLRELRKTWPKLPVIMFSTMTPLGADSTFKALAEGAGDYVTKPENTGSAIAAMAFIREQLAPKIKALCPNLPGRESAGAVRPQTGLSKGPRKKCPIERVVIGVSTGGPNALAEVIPALPGDLPVPVLIVQHMPPVFTRLLAERLNDKSKLKVKEAVEGELVQGGTVYIAPGDFHMTLSGGPAVSRIRLNKEPPENSCRPAVDVLFRSAAAMGAGTLAFVLTGMGQDGARGCQAIADAGGRVLAQDEATCVVWGMPGAVSRARLAEMLVPLPQIASQIVRIVTDRRAA